MPCGPAMRPDHAPREARQGQLRRQAGPQSRRHTEIVGQVGRSSERNSKPSPCFCLSYHANAASTSRSASGCDTKRYKFSVLLQRDDRGPRGPDGPAPGRFERPQAERQPSRGANQAREGVPGYPEPDPTEPSDIGSVRPLRDLRILRVGQSWPSPLKFRTQISGRRRVAPAHMIRAARVLKETDCRGVRIFGDSPNLRFGLHMAQNALG